jgi:hypothetical protein
MGKVLVVDSPRTALAEAVARELSRGERMAFYERLEPVVIQIAPIYREPEKQPPVLASNRKERRSFGNNKKRRLFRP